MIFNEEKFIAQLKKKHANFIGDDAAVLPKSTTEKYIISKDLLIEDIHFRTHYFSASDLAHKALNVNISDIAAMGAKPLYILCGISIPPNLSSYAQNFVRTLDKISKSKNIELIGGDTTAAKNKLYISITAVGVAKKNNIKYRHEAHNNDLIYVAGNLGWANLGLYALENNLNMQKKYVQSFLRPKAKIAEGQWLAKTKGINSMMDISDGLYIDLQRLCKASKVGAIIKLDLLVNYMNSRIDLNDILVGGEDYGLLFTCTQKYATKITQNFQIKFNYACKIIGKIQNNKKVLFTKNNKSISLDIKPFDHFN